MHTATNGTAQLIDPQLRGAYEAMPPMTLDDISAARQGLLEQFSQADGLPYDSRHIAGYEGAPDVEILIFNAAQPGQRKPAVLHIHGGGMVAGSARMAAVSAPAIIGAIDAVVVFVDYRLVPETPFPGPQDDCYAAMAWLFDHADELGVDPGRIIVMGESAGGGLAASLALMARDRRKYRPAGQVLIVPMLDWRTGADYDAHSNPVTGEFVWTREANQVGWRALQGNYAADDERKGWFSPALAEDLSDLPPTYIVAGGLDLFLDENLEYARRLVASRVPIELNLYAGVPHGFQLFADSDVSRRADADLRSALQRMAA